MAIEVREFRSGSTSSDAASAALSVPAYNVAGLPWAADYPNSIVIVKDNPQGQARSVPIADGWHWLSEVDGTDLGAGNAGPS